VAHRRRRRGDRGAERFRQLADESTASVALADFAAVNLHVALGVQCAADHRQFPGMVIDGCARQLAGAEHQRARATMGQYPQRSEIAPVGQRDRHLQHAIAVRIEQEVLAVGVQAGEQGLVIRHPAINEDQIRGRPAVDPHVLHHSIDKRVGKHPLGTFGEGLGDRRRVPDPFVDDRDGTGHGVLLRIELHLKEPEWC
jgi:hypothetical protein